MVTPTAVERAKGTKDQCRVRGACPATSGAAQSVQNTRSVSSPQHWQRWSRAAGSITYVVITTMLPSRKPGGTSSVYSFFHQQPPQLLGFGSTSTVREGCTAGFEPSVTGGRFVVGEGCKAAPAGKSSSTAVTGGPVRPGLLAAEAAHGGECRTVRIQHACHARSLSDPRHPRPALFAPDFGATPIAFHTFCAQPAC